MKPEKAKSLKIGTVLCTDGPVGRSRLIYSKACAEKMKTHNNPHTMWVMDDMEMILLSVRDLMPQHVVPSQSYLDERRRETAHEDLMIIGLVGGISNHKEQTD